MVQMMAVRAFPPREGCKILVSLESLNGTKALNETTKSERVREERGKRERGKKERKKGEEKRRGKEENR